MSREEPYSELTKAGIGPTEIFRQITEDHITPRLPDSDDDDHYHQINRLISQCWACDPDDRPQASDLIVSEGKDRESSN